MKVIKSASSNSVWRGLGYYQEKKVISYQKIDEFLYEGKVAGSDGSIYSVVLNIEHPRSSKCDCPHAHDRKIICKHLVALYFTIFPSEVDVFLKEVEEAQKEYFDYREDLYDKTMKYIDSMSKAELQDALKNIINIAPDWVYDRFVSDYLEI